MCGVILNTYQRLEENGMVLSLSRFCIKYSYLPSMLFVVVCIVVADIIATHAVHIRYEFVITMVRIKCTKNIKTHLWSKKFQKFFDKICFVLSSSLKRERTHRILCSSRSRAFTLLHTNCMQSVNRSVRPFGYISRPDLFKIILFDVIVVKIKKT